MPLWACGGQWPARSAGGTEPGDDSGHPPGSGGDVLPGDAGQLPAREDERDHGLVDVVGARQRLTGRRGAGTGRRGAAPCAPRLKIWPTLRSIAMAIFAQLR
jgi:hypothetical protein